MGGNSSICTGRPSKQTKVQSQSALLLNKFSAVANQPNHLLLPSSDDLSLSEQQQLTQAMHHSSLIPILQHLNNDTQLLSEVTDISHRWASSPETMGSLAVVYLGLSYNKAQSQTQQLKINSTIINQNILDNTHNYESSPTELFTQTLIQQNIAVYLNNNLSSYMNDRKELTTLLIYFLVKNNPEMQLYLLQTNVLPTLVSLIHPKQLRNLRMVAIKISTKLYRKREQAIQQFLANKGLEYLNDYLMTCEVEESKTGLRAIDLLTQIETPTGTAIYQPALQQMRSLQVEDTLQALIIRLAAQDINDTSNSEGSNNEFDYQKLVLAAQILQNNIIKQQVNHKEQQS